MDPREPSATEVVPVNPTVSPVAETMPTVSPTAPTTAPVAPSGSHPPLPGGETIGAFKIVGHLGRGGMGDVYRAHDVSLDRDVALKTVAPFLVQDRAFIERFHSEAKSAARIQHPNVVQVYSWGEERGVVFFAMELVQGTSVGEHLATRGAFTWQDAARIALQVTRALEAAHAHGVIHRDIKPENILLAPDGTAKVADFGLAKRVADAGTTASGVIVGTPRYMSPEQAQGETLDERSDIYSLGATLFHMLAGQPVFDGSSPMKVCLRHIQEAPPDLSTVASHIPPELARCVNRMLAKKREQRYATHKELVQELESILGSGAAARVPISSSAPTAPAARPPLIQVVKRPDGAVEVDLNLGRSCPTTGSSLSDLHKKARADSPSAPLVRRLVADATDLAHLGVIFAVLGLVPLLGKWAPFDQTAAAILITFIHVQYLTRHGGSIGERLMDVRLVTRSGGIPPFPSVGMGWIFSKVFPFVLAIVVISWDKVFPLLGGVASRIEVGCSILGLGALLEYGLLLATGASLRDRIFKTRVIDVRGLSPEDDWL
jgi:serine/threonine protein kinase